jgi:hypothetical protein
VVKRSSHSSSEKPRIKESVIIEKSPYSEEKLSEMRMLLLRDEIDTVISMIGSSGRDLRYMAMLLEDEGMGVPVIAADVLKEACVRGIDISCCEEALKKALLDKYAKRNAAGALMALYLSNGDNLEASSLAGSGDPEISRAAMDVIREAAEHA